MGIGFHQFSWKLVQNALCNILVMECSGHVRCLAAETVEAGVREHFPRVTEYDQFLCLTRLVQKRYLRAEIYVVPTTDVDSFDALSKPLDLFVLSFGREQAGDPDQFLGYVSATPHDDIVAGHIDEDVLVLVFFCGD